MKGYWTTAGRPTFAVDGSKFTAPRTAANQAAFAAATDGASADGGGPLEALNLAECRNADESQRTTSKASRRYPRKKKRRPCGKPKLRKATKEEIEAAKAFL